MLRHLTSMGLLAGLLITAAPAWAATCAKREMVVDKLKGKYAEQLTAGGLQASRTTTAVVEVWASPKTGTFTVIMTNAHGISCIVASGTDWFAQQPVIEPVGTAS